MMQIRLRERAGMFANGVTRRTGIALNHEWPTSPTSGRLSKVTSFVCVGMMLPLIDCGFTVPKMPPFAVDDAKAEGL